jgi:hypothetical protein
MLNYSEVKKFYANKLASDFEGIGRVESAEYHTHKMVYLKGVEDGLAAAGLPDAEIQRIIGVVG